MQTVALDDDVAEILAEDGSLEAATREALVMELFRRGRLSVGRACDLLHLSRDAFSQRASELGIPYFLMSRGDWAVELATIEAWRRS